MIKRKNNSSKGVVKGSFRGVVISVLIHGAAFLVAGLVVVFTVTKKEEPAFEPPKAVERPKMKLKKPKVRIKKSSKPKAASRIVTTMKRSAMPILDLPDMGGVGDGFGGEIAGFELLPDLTEISLMGSEHSIGNDFVGTFYDMKRDARGNPNNMDTETFKDVVSRFVRGGWKPSTLGRYYRSEKTLYATSIMIPSIRSSVAPLAFGETDTGGWCWLAHYKGKLVHHKDIKFRFWGMADDILIVRVNGKVVLDGSWPAMESQDRYVTWQSTSSQTRIYRLGGNLSSVGDWITLKAGVPVDMELVLGEVPGGGFCSLLLVEEEGVEYEQNRHAGPILPMFKTSEPSHDQLDSIYEWHVAEQATLTNGPIFRDFVATARSNSAPVEVALDEPMPEDPAEDPMRVWTYKNGETAKAEFTRIIGRDAVMKTSTGKFVKVPLAEFGDEDLEYIELASPPSFDVSFKKESKQRLVDTSPFLNETMPKVLEYTFGAKLRKTGTGTYNHNIHVEFFALGQQILDGDKYKLLDRQEISFNPSEIEGREFEFSGNTVTLTSYDMAGSQRGIKYGEYLIIVTDARGKIVQHRSSCKWLFPNLEELRKRSVGQFLDESCKRVYPTGPKANY